MKQVNPQLSPWGLPVLLGIPLDHNSSFLRGPAQAPSKIREALRSDAWNSWANGRIDLAQPGLFEDAGDLSNMGEPDAFERIEQAVAKIVESKKRPLCLGGDHSISYPILRAVGKRVPGITLVHFDAHPDLYADYEGNPHSHASPFARIMENQLVQRLVQIGVRTLNDHQRLQAEKYGVEIYAIENLPDLAKLNLAGPLYVSFDVDALDPAFAPGVSHWEPGGLSTREAIEYLQGLPAPIVGADIVELNPVRDTSGLTATVAAKLLKELLGKMLLGQSDNHH
jgi:arginase